MNVRRWIGVGATAALLASGCAAHPGPAQSQKSGTTSPTANPAGSPGSLDQAKWEAHATPADDRPSPQQLAERTANYARTMESPANPSTDSPAPHGLASADPSPSAVHFDTPAVAPPARPVDVSVPALPQTPPPAVPPDPRAAVLASATKNNVLSDMPQDVPDSAEFAPSPSATRGVDPLGPRLAKRAKANPEDPAAQLDYQLYAMLNNGPDAPEATLASAAGLPSDERDVIATLVDGVSNFRSTVAGDPNLTPTQQIRPLQEMVDRLRSGADLTLGTVALCKRVTGFGLYEPLSPARFPAGVSSQLYVYCEVDNFLPRKTADGQWETRLAQRVSLYTADGTVVWEDKARGVSDVCRDRRRDFFTKEPIVLPPTLDAGAYKLKVTVTDRNANKVAESDAPLWVGGT